MSKKLQFNAPKFENILTARPKNMSYQKYKKLRREQNHRLKERLHGFMVWRSKAYGIINANGENVSGGESWGTLIGHVPTVRIK